MESVLIASIVMGGTALVGVLGKLLMELRKNIKKCWGIEFRSNSPNSSVNNIELSSTQVPVIPTMPLPVHNQEFRNVNFYT